MQSIGWRRIARRVATLSCLVIVVLGIVTWCVGNSLIAPATRIVGPPPSDLNAVTTTLASRSGSSIATWYIPAANAEATIVLLHPLRTDRRAMLSRARLFHNAGYAVIMIDF